MYGIVLEYDILMWIPTEVEVIYYVLTNGSSFDWQHQFSSVVSLFYMAYGICGGFNSQPNDLIKSSVDLTQHRVDSETRIV